MLLVDSAQRKLCYTFDVGIAPLDDFLKSLNSFCRLPEPLLTHTDVILCDDTHPQRTIVVVGLLSFSYGLFVTLLIGFNVGSVIERVDGRRELALRVRVSVR